MDAINSSVRIGGPAPHGSVLRCRGWQQEGVLRCFLNTLDPAVAEDSERRGVYRWRGAGRACVGPGLGGMGGAQGLAIANLGGRGLIIEVDRERAERRRAAGWVDRIAPSYDAAVADLVSSAESAAIAVIGNVAEVLPRLVADRV